MKKITKLFLSSLMLLCAQNTNELLAITPTDNINTIWQTYYGGNYQDIATGIVVDSEGNSYILGESTTPNLSYGAVYQPTKNGTTDLLLSKFSADGIRLWTTYWGGSTGEYATDLTLDNAGNIIVVGYTNALDIPMTSGVHQTSNAGSTDGIIGKFSPDGQLIWSSYFGGTGVDYIYSVTVDTSDNIYVGGYTTSTNGIASASAQQLTRSGSADAFLTKLSSTGQLLYSSYIGGNGFDEIHSIRINDNGAIYIAGYSTSTTGFASNTYNGSGDAFIGKYSSLDEPTWIKYFGGSQSDGAYDLDLDSQGNIVVCGYTKSANFPATGFQTTAGSSTNYSDGFLTKFNSEGTMMWSSFFGGERNDYIHKLKVLNDNSIFIAGETQSTTGIALANSDQNSIASTKDGFYSFISADGSSKIKSTYFGGNNDDQIKAIDFYNDNYYFTGTTSSSNLLGECSFQSAKSSYTDLFISKISSAQLTHYITLNSVSNDSVCSGSNITINYDSFGEYNSDNTFQVQLSDATGSFLNPTILSFNSGSNSVVKIPATTSPSENYFVRVIATSPATKSNSCLQPISIYTGNTIFQAKAYFEGLWNGTTQPEVPTIIEFRTGGFLKTSVKQFTKLAKFDTTGILLIDLADVPPNSYWIVIRTPGYFPIAFSKTTVPNCEENALVFDFTTSSSSCKDGLKILKKFNENSTSPWMIKVGDVNRDLNLNSTDVELIIKNTGNSITTIPKN